MCARLREKRERTKPAERRCTTAGIATDLEPLGPQQERIEPIKKGVSPNAMTLAQIRTERASTEIWQMLSKVAKACGLFPGRVMWSQSSDFGFGELYSNRRMLIMLLIGAGHTELVSVSPTEEPFVRELEDAVTS